MYRVLLTTLFYFLFLASYSQNSFYKEKYRPQFHFTPPIHWTNDPNGLVYHNGSYHLFYQYNPMGILWGHMSWGHAVSKDLIHWEHLPLAIPEEDGVMIFSGSCVSDINNTSGLGSNKNPPLVAVYTGHIDGVNQSQHLAYSLDDGLTWKKYEKNPVLDLKKKDFRDPKVFWYQQEKYWVMAVVLPDEHIVQFYSSHNLKEWKHLSDFGPAGDIDGVWECPDLSEVPIEGEKRKTKWLLQVSQNSTMQYFIGDFDGKKFEPEKSEVKISRPDYGSDYYAGITFNNLPVSVPPTSIGWINNWAYARDIPTTPWRGMMSIPRSLSVKKIDDEWVLLQQPTDEIKSIRASRSHVINNSSLDDTKSISFKSQQFQMDITLQPGNGSICGVRIAKGKNNELEIGYHASTNMLYIDRSKAGISSFSTEFEKRNRCETELPLDNGDLQLQIFFDNSVVEVFANDGRAVMTMQLFPEENDSNVELFSKNEKSIIKTMSVWRINSIW